MTDIDILEQLRQDERAYQYAARAAERKREARNETLRRALEQHTHAEVARTLEITRSRVGQLALKLRSDP